MAAAVLLMMLAIVPTARASAILNGGFEVGSFDDWTAVPPPSDPLFFVSGNPHSGSYAAWFGTVGLVDETIWQTFATTPGEGYIIDFWLAHGATDSQNDFSVMWNGVPILSLVNAPSFDYTEYIFHETALGTSSTLQFAGREVLDYYYVDDVTVVPNPEPASLVLLGTGLAGLVRARRRHRGRSA